MVIFLTGNWLCLSALCSKICLKFRWNLETICDQEHWPSLYGERFFRLVVLLSVYNELWSFCSCGTVCLGYVFVYAWLFGLWSGGINTYIAHRSLQVIVVSLTPFNHSFWRLLCHTFWKRLKRLSKTEYRSSILPKTPHCLTTLEAFIMVYNYWIFNLNW